LPHDVEQSRCAQPTHETARDTASIEVYDVHGRLPDRESRDVRENQELNERKHNDLHERRAIANDVQHLGPSKDECATRESASGLDDAHCSRT